jgi:hypothetical protein
MRIMEERNTGMERMIAVHHRPGGKVRFALSDTARPRERPFALTRPSQALLDDQ